MREKREIANEVIAAAIRRRRIEDGWTQEVLADAVGMSRSAITNLEASRHGLAVDQLIVVTDTLGMSLPHLFAEVREAWEKHGQGH